MTPTDSEVARDVPELLEVHALYAISGVVLSPYWQTHYTPTHGGPWPSVVFTERAEHLGVEAFQDSDGISYWEEGQGVLFLTPDASGLIGIHEMAHLLCPLDGHGAEWAAHFHALAHAFKALEDAA